jgi:hypothetical protein
LALYTTVVKCQEEVVAALASLQATVQDEVEPKGRPFPKIKGPKCLNSKIGIIGAGSAGVHMAYDRGRQDHFLFDLKSNQSLDLFLLILDLRSIFFKIKD